MQFKDRDFEFVLTNGPVSRVISEGGGQRWLQHNADINPGNSGGPLVAADGLVYGINTLMIRNANGVFASLAIPQLRREIQEHVPFPPLRKEFPESGPPFDLNFIKTDDLNVVNIEIAVIEHMWPEHSRPRSET